MEDLKLLEDCKCCISQHLQFEAEKFSWQARVLVSLLGKRHEKSHD